MPETPHIDPQSTETERMLPPKKSSVGPLIGIIIILVLLVVGAFYIWGQRLNEKHAAEQAALELKSSTTTLPDITRVRSDATQQ